MSVIEPVQPSPDDATLESVVGQSYRLVVLTGSLADREYARIGFARGGVSALRKYLRRHQTSPFTLRFEMLVRVVGRRGVAQGCYYALQRALAEHLPELRSPHSGWFEVTPAFLTHLNRWVAEAATDGRIASAPDREQELIEPPESPET